MKYRTHFYRVLKKPDTKDDYTYLLGAGEVEDTGEVSEETTTVESACAAAKRVSQLYTF